MWENTKEIMKKQAILSLYESNVSKQKAAVRDKQSDYLEVNKILYEWLTLTTSKSVYPGGTQLQE